MRFAVMGAFVLLFIIRMAGAAMEQKEDAEASTRLSEDRFRSLIQSSSDVTLVMGTAAVCTLRESSHHPAPGIRRRRDLIGRRATDYIHPDERDRVRDRMGSQLQSSPGPQIQFRMERAEGIVA